MKQPYLRLLALTLAIGLALLGQRWLPDAATTTSGLLAFALAIMLAAAALWRAPIAPAPDPIAYTPGETRPLLPLRPLLRLLLALLGLMLLLLAWPSLANNTFTRTGTTSWLLGLAIFLAAFAEAPATWVERWRQRRQRLLAWGQGLTLHLSWTWLALLVILLLASFFRFYRLPTLPLDAWSDQAEKLLDVNDVVNGLRPIFFPRNTGREAMQFYLTAGLVSLTGLPVGYLVLKLGTALVSLWTVPWVYGLVRELYGRGAALIATTLFAVSHWHVAISRVGLRFPFTAAFATPALLFFLRALRRNRRNDWLAAGFFLGAGLHTYIPMRIVPLLLVALAAIKLGLDGWSRWRDRSAASTTTGWQEASSFNRTFWENAVLGGATSIFVFLPLLRYMADEPDMFWYRATTRSLDGGMTLADQWQTFWSNVWRALQMFNYDGDVVPTNTIPHSPAVDWVTGGLLVLGLVVLLVSLLQWRDRRALYVLASWFVLLLPSILSLAFPQENPSVVRTGGAIPWVVLVAALPLVALGRLAVASQLRWPRPFIVLLAGGLLATAIGANYVWYFRDYATHYKTAAWNTTELGDVVADFANSVGDLTHAYHVPYPHWADSRLIGIEAGQPGWQNTVTSREQLLIQAQDPASKLYLLHPEDVQTLGTLELVYPNGRFERRVSSYPDKDFIIFYVPSRE